MYMFLSFMWSRNASNNAFGVVLELFIFCVFAAEGVQLVHDFGMVLQRIQKPALGGQDATIHKALLMFMQYFETNETFDLLTHGMGPGLLGLVIHALIEFLGPNVCSIKADCNTTPTVAAMHLGSYVAKINDIVETVVVDETDPVSGKLAKKSEDKVVKQKKVKIKVTERKVQKQDTPTPSEDEDNDAVEAEDDDGSCSSDEAAFSTLSHSSGVQYKPMSKKREPIRFGVNRKSAATKSGDSTKLGDFQELISRAEILKKTDKDQKATIARLKQEKAEVLKKLVDMDAAEKEESRRKGKKSKSVGKDKSSVAATTSAGASTSQFVTDSMQVDITSSASDIEVEDDMPDSTLKPRRNSEGSIVIEPSQLCVVKRKRRRIDSDEQSEATGPGAVDDDVFPQSSNTSTTLAETVRQRDELQDRVDDMAAKLLEVEMVGRGQDYSDAICANIRKFREALINAVGEDLDVNPEVQGAKDCLIDSCNTYMFMGYTFRVGTDFVNRI